MKTKPAKSSSADDFAFGQQRGRELAAELNAVLKQSNTAGKVPAWVANAWRHLAQDFFGIPTAPNAEPTPQQLGKQMALLHTAVHHFRTNPLQTAGADADLQRVLEGAAEGIVLGAILDVLRQGHRPAAEFFESFAKVKREAADSPEGDLGRATAPLYFALIMWWEAVEKCPTRTAVFKLMQEWGIVTKDQYGAFLALCKRIKLNPARRGRPKTG